MSLETVATARYLFQRALSRRAVVAALAVWKLIDPDNVQGSWRANRLGQRLFVSVSTAQVMAATAGADYVAQAIAEQGVTPAATEALDPSSLAGVASDGRELDSLLVSPVVSTLTDIRQGVEPELAVSGGAASLARIVDTQVADAGRVATQVAMAVEPTAIGYVRMINPPACARCVILAGATYVWSEGFERHPLCQCTHVPSAESAGVLDDVRTNPMDYFRSLSTEDQNRIFTAGGAEAIRLGADLNQVVNVRRRAAGISTAGGFARVGGRLMPEGIMAAADGDRTEALRLLRRFGYIAR